MIFNKAIVDVETTTIDKGHPFNPDNKLVVVGILPCTDDWKVRGEPQFVYGKKILEESLKKYSALCFHNAKFDMHWIRRTLGKIPGTPRIYDTQIAEFLITNQMKPFPSLNDCGLKYLNEEKIDNIQLNYWNKGIDTSLIPREELEEYLKQDLVLTQKVFRKQIPLLYDREKWELFELQMADTVVLEEMEYNGMLFDTEGSLEKSKELEIQIERLAGKVGQHSNIPDFNSNSNDHLSLLLYGGIYNHETRLPIGVYKTGAKVGQPRYKIYHNDIICPRLVEPIKGSELAKAGYWSTDEATLKSLKPPTKEIKTLIKEILDLSKVEKQNGTYFKGIPKLIKNKNWENNIIHGQLNQCVAITGRLSASKPNQQNFDPEAKRLCKSRYI